MDRTADSSYFRSEPYYGAEGTDFEGLMAYVYRPDGAKFYAVRFFDGVTDLHELKCFKSCLHEALDTAKSFTDGIDRSKKV